MALLLALARRVVQFAGDTRASIWDEKREQRRPIYASGIHDAAITLQMIVGPQRSHLEGKRLEIPLADRGNPWIG